MADEKLKRFLAALVELGTPGSRAQRALLKPIADRLKKRIRQQINTGTGPTGATQKAIKSGKRPGLMGNRIANPIKVEPTERGTIRIFVDVAGGAPQWMEDALEAHQHGHTWPARSQRAAFNAKGRMISFAKLKRATAASQRLERGELEEREVEDVFGRTTKRGLARVRARIRRLRLGERVLPQRQIYPEGSLPAPWRSEIEQGLKEGFAAFLEKAMR